MVLTTPMCQNSLISLTMLEHSMKYLLVFFKLLAHTARWHSKCPSANCKSYCGTKNVAGNSIASNVFGAILPLPNSVGWDHLRGVQGRTEQEVLSPGYECRCGGGSTAVWSGIMELELRCCCVSLVLSLLLNSRSGIGFVSSPWVFGACSDCRGVLLCHCYSLRQGRVLLCRSSLCLSPRCSSPE